MDIPPRIASKRTPVAWCLEPHDLVLSKLVRGSERDWEYARAAVRADIVQIDLLISRAVGLPVSAQLRQMIVSSLKAVASRPTDGG